MSLARLSCVIEQMWSSQLEVVILESSFSSMCGLCMPARFESQHIASRMPTWGAGRLRFRCDYHLNRHSDIVQAEPASLLHMLLISTFYRANFGEKNKQKKQNKKSARGQPEALLMELAAPLAPVVVSTKLL